MTIFRCDRHRCAGRNADLRQSAFRWRWIHALAGMMIIGGCSVAKSEKLECLSSPDLNGRDAHLSSSEGRKASAQVALELVQRVRAKAKSSWFGTGILSDIFGRTSGTEGVALHLDVRQLRVAVANQKAIDLAKEIGGRSPLPASADWACQILANSVASLDTGQSDDQFLENLSVVETYLKRVYTTNGGQDLEKDMVNLQTSKAEK